MKNKTKIRLEVSSLASRSISGVGNYTKQMAEALNTRSDIDLELCYFDFLNRQPEPGLDKSALKPNKFIPLRAYAKLQSFGAAWPFDIFKSKVDLTIFPNFATWPTVRSRCSMTTIHDLSYLYYPETVEQKNLEYLRRIVPKTISQASFILTVSESVKNEIVKEFGIDPSKIIVTYNTAASDFYEKRSKENIRKTLDKYNIPQSKYIYFIGNFEPRKNLANLIKAYCMLPKNLKDEYSLVLAGGKGWKSQEAQLELTNALNSKEKVFSIGYIDQKDSPALYQGASLFVMPSIYEGFGIPILEAMASGCPVVASDIPVLKETAGKAADFFEPNDPLEISHFIEKALQNKNRREKLVELGQENLSRFSWDNNIDSLLQAINNEK